MNKIIKKTLTLIYLKITNIGVITKKLIFYFSKIIKKIKLISIDIKNKITKDRDDLKFLN